jgi:hypothetical protein
VTIKLLPKGSPALLGPAQIEAMLHRSLLHVSSLQRQNAALKGELTGAQNQKQGLSAALAEWAKANGFATIDVDTKVQQLCLAKTPSSCVFFAFQQGMSCAFQADLNG